MANMARGENPCFMRAAAITSNNVELGSTRKPHGIRGFQRCWHKKTGFDFLLGV